MHSRLRIINFTRNIKGKKVAGESISVNTLTSMLKDREHNVLTISVEKENIRENGFIGIKATTRPILPKIDTVISSLELYRQHKNTIDDVFKEFKPDLCIYRKEASYLACRIAKKHKVPSILKLYDYEFYYGNLPNGWNPRFNILLHIPIPFYKYICDYILNNTSLIIGNSNRTANLYSRITNNAHIYGIPSFIDISDVKPLDIVGSRIVHITPSKNKGIDITLDVAESLPDKDFLIIGQMKGWNAKDTYKRINDISNVDYIGYVANIEDIYKKAYIILMPSLDEGYGRIPIEAGAYGIPTITSGNGGLIESSVPQLVVKSNDKSCYIDKIKEVENDYNNYRALSIENARKKCSDVSFEMFMNVVYNTLGISL